MKTSDLRAKDAAGLEKEVSDLLKAHFGLRMQKATQQLTNHSQMGKTRRDIARAKTIQAEQRLGIKPSEPKPGKVAAKPAKSAKKTGAKK